MGIAYRWNQHLRKTAERYRCRQDTADLEYQVCTKLVEESRGEEDSAGQSYSNSKTHAHKYANLKREGSPSRSQSSPKRCRSPTVEPGFSRCSQPKGRLWDFDKTPAEFSRGASRGTGSLWNPDDDNTTLPRPQSYDKTNLATNRRLPLTSTSHRRLPSQNGRSQGVDGSVKLTKQPETRPISQEQLVAEVKGIYAGLVMVENKCIEVDGAQSTQNDPSKLNNEQWQALIALHRTLLHEHHDFFLASQYPLASPALRRLASKYSMQARMWRHGIHSFLELLRQCLLTSPEHMLSFIYLAYSMMALLYETVPAFEDTWNECLGDLGRYRMAIEDDDIRDWETWTAQLFYSSKSLCAAIPFFSAREIIMMLFDPVMAPNSSQQSRLPSTEHAFVKTHGIIFGKKMYAKLDTLVDEFTNTLDGHIGHRTCRFLEPGYCIGLSNCCAITGYGSGSNPICSAVKRALSDEQQDQQTAGSEANVTVAKGVTDALNLANRTHDVILRQFGDPNILPYIHILVYYFHPDRVQKFSRTRGGRFHPTPPPPPEDYALRGLLRAKRYFPTDWFTNEKIEDEKTFKEQGENSDDFQQMPEDNLISGPIPHLGAAKHLFGRAYSNIVKRLGGPPITLRQILHFAVFTIFAHTLAEPVDPWRIPKIISVGTTAVSSLGLSVASLQLDMAEPSKGNMGLRVVCSVLVSVLTVLYSLLFLTHKRKAKQFIEGICVGDALCFLFVRLVGSSGDDKASSGNNNYIIRLDKFNLSALVAVVFGILNAERSLFTGNSPRIEDDHRPVDVNDANSNNGQRSSDADDRTTANDRRRHRRHDEDRRNVDGDGGIDLTDIVVGTAAQNIFPA
ncbi:hypothetical protein MFIFM68171_03087 [Madurella fahalii]|uniref:DNA/RNA-binding domain-containing protein n=1 Tax=Madurella fahalii TaxID=1157608 RepID=A0ABQ0G529_9PEZI